MNRLPLRVRLTAAFALGAALLLTGAALFVYLRLASDLGAALDQDLRARAQDVSALVRGGGSLGTTGGRLVEPGETFAQLLGRDGRVLDGTGPLRTTPRLLAAPQLKQARRAPLFVNRGAVPGLDEPSRLLAVPVDASRVLVVGATRENRAESLASLRDAFLVGGPLVLALAALGGYVLAGSALRPIEAMRRRAEAITTSSLDERLPVAATSDEVARLGTTLNEMLARIEAGVERERRFVADASHELRTPLALLRTELELALRRERSPEELRAALASAAAEADRLERLAEDLLLLARSDRDGLSLRLEPTDVADVVAAVAARFSARAEGESRSLVVGADDAPVVLADRGRLEQALGNLLDNALRHGDGAVVVEATAHAGGVELRVRDEGAGFPPDFAPRAFERFSRADEARGGTGSGLGLAIVDAVARAHGGRARVADPAGGGAEVRIELPLAASGYDATITRTTVASPSTTPTAATARTKRVSGAA